MGRKVNERASSKRGSRGGQRQGAKKNDTINSPVPEENDEYTTIEKVGADDLGGRGHRTQWVGAH